MRNALMPMCSCEVMCAILTFILNDSCLSLSLSHSEAGCDSFVGRSFFRGARESQNCNFS